MPKYEFRGWREAEAGSDVAVRITGPDPNELFGLADRIKQKTQRNIHCTEYRRRLGAQDQKSRR